MTCIAGIEQDGRVWIGGDSAAGSGGWGLTVRADEKVFTTGPFLMGFTTSFRMGQLLRYRLSVPAPTVDVDDVRYMSTTFVDAVRQCLKDGGYARVENGQESGGTFLVGYKGSLYMVYGDYQVGSPVDGFAAVGCGQDIALGALAVTKTLAPAKRIKLALAAAERFSGGVRGPFIIVDAT